MVKKSSLKSTAAKGVFWSAIDKFAVKIAEFIIGIVLARLLMPNDFGLIGMLSIFLAISESFINSGLGSGLIQKQDRTEKDFSTVFVFNLVISVFFYLILFFTAPFIADFYNKPILVPLTRVLTLIIVINSLGIVQRSKLTIDINFKVFAIVNVMSVFLGGIVGLVMAVSGFGVWAIVGQYLTGAIISITLLWFLNNWKPSFYFSISSFKNLFGFGSKLLIAGLYAKAFDNVYNIAIGKVYSASELGFYTRAKSFAIMSSGTVTNILQQVTYPILSSIQDDKKRLISAYSRIIRMTSFFIFPVMTLIAILAEPIVIILLGEKWRPVITLLQWMCFARVFYPISSINMSILNAIGRSDLFLKVDLSKMPILIIILLITIPLGVEEVIIGHVISSMIAFFINSYMPGKLFGYGAKEQIKDMLPIFISTAIMALVVGSFSFIISNLYIKLILGLVIGFAVYVLTAILLKVPEIKEIKVLINKHLNKDRS